VSVANNGHRRLLDAELDPLAARLAREVAEELAAQQMVDQRRSSADVLSKWWS